MPVSRRDRRVEKAYCIVKEDGDDTADSCSGRLLASDLQKIWPVSLVGGDYANMQSRAPTMCRAAALLAALGGCTPLWLDAISTEFTNGSGTETSATAVGAFTGSGTPTTTLPGESSSSQADSDATSAGSETAGTSGPGGTTLACIPETHTQCVGGDVHWVDSCDVVGALKESCGVSGPVGAPSCVDGDLYSDFKTVGCEAGGCTSQTSPKLIENCDEDGCIDNACVGCSYTHAVTAFECPDFSSSIGGGDGGGELMEVCGTVDPPTGFMTVRARKFDGNLFGDRPYQVRVSLPADEPCSPDANYFIISDDAPAGVGTDELLFTYQSIWLPGQTEKAYCVTASTKPGDPGYDANDKLQTSWYWSQKLVMTRSCR